MGTDYLDKVRSKLVVRESGEGSPLPDSEATYKRLQTTMGELGKLKALAKKKKEAFVRGELPPEEVFVPVCVKTDGRKPSVKEFDFEKEIGVGNFSRIVKAKHKTTGEVFAIKIIEKKQVEQLKRRHPNVHNEVFMERRVLQKLDHPLVVNLYQTFQDYNALYYLMDYCSGAEMWSMLLYEGKLVGAHPSMSKFYLAELVEVLQYIHSVGIVHRDLKPENLMVSSDGHLKLIDFGTAKDLVETDRNGPEFVGTPEFMSPEAVKSKPAGHESDLWSLGIVAYQMFLGTTPFKSPSPYLGFLKIKRCQLLKPDNLSEDEFDLIRSLCQLSPEDRLGASEPRGDLSAVMNHPYFEKSGLPVGECCRGEAVTVPSLRDLCIRACVETCIESSLDPSSPEPGAGGWNDMLRLNGKDRKAVMHVLDRLEKLHQPRVFRRFFKTTVEAKTGKVRRGTRDFVGLTNELQSQFADGFDFVPIFDLGDKVTPEEDVAYMKRQIKTVNKLRPKFVVAIGRFGREDTRRILSKTSETINLVVVDGREFFTFWVGGTQNVVLVGDLMLNPQDDLDRAERQMMMVQQELEQSKMCQHHTYVYTDVDPRLLPESFKAKCLASRVNAIIGISATGGPDTETDFLYKKPEDMDDGNDDDGNDDDDDDDDKPKIEDVTGGDDDSSDDSDLDMAAEDDTLRIICGWGEQTNDKLLTFELSEEMQFEVSRRELLK